MKKEFNVYKGYIIGAVTSSLIISLLLPDTLRRFVFLITFHAIVLSIIIRFTRKIIS